MAVLFNILIRGITFLGLTMLAAFGVYKVLPEQVRLKVPFTSQAPEGVWTEPWQNACEEASIIMIDNFYKGSTLTKDEAKKEILNIFDIKEEKFGPSFDESMGTIAAIINSSNLNWRVKVIEEPTIEGLKKELAESRPIIVPVNARELDNPYYTGEGPDYHVVVVVGYDDKLGEFLVHDPGTTQGEDFGYSYQEFYNSIGDFLSGSDDGASQKRVLYTMPKN